MIKFTLRAVEAEKQGSDAARVAPYRKPPTTQSAVRAGFTLIIARSPPR
jgi:hypothetical protein